MEPCSWEYRDVKKYFIHEIDSYKIVFIDGKYSSHLSETTHDGIDVCLMSAALSKPKYQLVIQKYFNQVAEKDGLSSLNTAFSNEVFVLYLKSLQICSIEGDNLFSIIFEC